MKFAIFGNTYQAKKSSHAENLFRLLAQHQAQLCVCREFYNFLTSDLHLNIPPAELFDGDDFRADMVISIGGDGTFLKAASPASAIAKITFLRTGVITCQRGNRDSDSVLDD